MSKLWRSVDRNQVDCLPPSVDDLLPERHLARFVVEVVEQLDLSPIVLKYEKRNRGASLPYHPSLLVSLLFYGYATGVFSSRKIERATYDSLAFRFIAGGLHPDHDTIAGFRTEFRGELKAFFHAILLLAREMGFLRCGSVSLDGTKIHANASKHSAVSHGRAGEIEAKLAAEVEELMKKAAEADSKPVEEGLDIPAEIERRKDRMEKLAAAREAIEARAAEAALEKLKADTAEFQAKLSEAESKASAGDRFDPPDPPKAPDSAPEPKAQHNFTDPESRIMKTPGGFEQCYNGQLSVDTASRLIVGQHVTQACNDKRELIVALAMISSVYGKPLAGIADAGFGSEEQIGLVKAAFPELDLFVAAGRTRHHAGLSERFGPDPAPAPEGASEMEKMRTKLRTKAGRKIYALRKQTVEPVIGIIKSVLGFRQFLHRGVDKVSNEWGLVCLGYNLKRIFALKMAKPA